MIDTEKQMRAEEPLAARLPSDALRKLLSAAIHMSGDKSNPIRGNAFAFAMREIFTQLLHEKAPDAQVAACAWFTKETPDGRPSRAQRQRYMIQGGLNDDYVRDMLGLDAAELHKEVGKAFATLNKATHVREETIVFDDKDVAALVGQSLSAAEGLLDAIDECRGELLNALSSAVSDQATEEVLRETIQEIDEKAGHYTIEMVWIDEIETEEIDAQHVWFKVTGTIDAELRYGSSSDFRNGDGATIDHSFPFKCRVPATVADPKQFQIELIDLQVEDGGWYD